MQSFFIGVGQTMANALPFLLSAAGVVGAMASGIPLPVEYSFKVGAVIFLLAVLWTVATSPEYPPEDPEAFARMRRARRGVLAGFGEIFHAVREMPATMRQLAVVQFFTWFALPCMWQFFSLAVARHVFRAPDERSPLFAQGVEWAGVCFAVYNVVCFLVAFALPWLAAAVGRKGVHAFALVCGGLGLISVYFIRSRYGLWLSMAGVGVAWASILSMPYVILSSSIPPARLGVYMGVFNLFIVIPQAVMSFVVPRVFDGLLGGDPLRAVVLGGISLLLAAGTVAVVRDVASEPGPASVAAEVGAHS
jgi:maltose/moltooligosaccharide transporter